MHGGIEFPIVDPPPPTLWVRTANKDRPNSKYHVVCVQLLIKASERKKCVSFLI